MRSHDAVSVGVIPELTTSTTSFPVTRIRPTGKRRGALSEALTTSMLQRRNAIAVRTVHNGSEVSN